MSPLSLRVSDCTTETSPVSWLGASRALEELPGPPSMPAAVLPAGEAPLGWEGAARMPTYREGWQEQLESCKPFVRGIFREMVRIFCVIPLLVFLQQSFLAADLCCLAPLLCLKGLCEWAPHICALNLRGDFQSCSSAVGSQRGNSGPLGLHWDCLSQPTTGASAEGCMY